MINIDIKEIVRLKEAGMSDRKIVEQLASQGIKVSKGTIGSRLTEYYDSIGQEKPKIKGGKERQELQIGEIIRLKEAGMTDKEIAEQLVSQGIKVKRGTIRNRLTEYYESIGEEKPRAKTRQELPIEEIVRLKEAGMSDEKIVEQLASQGIKVERGTIQKRLTEYYESIGEEKPRAKTRQELPIEEIVRLKEAGMSDGQIAKFISKKESRTVKSNSVSQKLIRYYKSNGKEKPRQEAKPKKELSMEEIVKLKEAEMTDEEIIEYLANQGIKVVTIRSRISEYHKQRGESKLRGRPKKELPMEELITEEKYDSNIKNILMNGMTIDEYSAEEGKEKRESVELTIRKLKFLAQHVDKKDGQWVQDNNFELLLNHAESDDITAKTQEGVNVLVKNGQCRRENLRDIIDIHLGGNAELAVYILTRLNLLYTKVSARDFRTIRTRYEQKIDEYLEKLHTIEENIARNKAECYELPQKRETEDEQK